MPEHLLLMTPSWAGGAPIEEPGEVAVVSLLKSRQLTWTWAALGAAVRLAVPGR